MPASLQPWISDLIDPIPEARAIPYFRSIERSFAMLPSHEGRRVPDVTFRIRENNEWKNVTTHDLFDRKTVAVFSLPGAFTPTCSSTHLPRFNELAPAFFANGVDSIVCISVNDPFVINEWAKDQECSNITVIPDGNGEFTAGMGMLVDKTDLGFGKRSWRYSMLVKDGVVEKMFVEPQEPGDPFKVSDADTLLAHINPSRQEARPGRDPDARRLRLLREGEGLAHKARIRLCRSATAAQVRTRVVGAITGDGTVPQVFINGERIGGLEALERWARKAA
jgi:peroxiredoxin